MSEQASGEVPSGDPLQEAHHARRLPGWLWALGLPMVAGALVGLVWWFLAPTAPVQVALSGETLLVSAPSMPELSAAQDSVMALLGLAAGAATGVVVAARARARPLTLTLVAAVGSALGSAVALAIGVWLGPATLAAQGALSADAPDGSTGADGSLLSPLGVDAPAALLVWPLVALLVAALGHAVAAWRLARASEVAHAEAGGQDDDGTAVTAVDVAPR